MVWQVFLQFLFSTVLDFYVFRLLLGSRLVNGMPQREHRETKEKYLKTHLKRFCSDDLVIMAWFR